MNETNFRVENKSNVNMNGKRTQFALYQRRGDAFVHAGQFTAPGWNANDSKCIAAALEGIDQESQK